MRMVRLVVGAGYHGWIGIEYEGTGLSEPEGILATKKLLERVRAEMQA
jgi:hydroxypyruvate isomerase